MRRVREEQLKSNLLKVKQNNSVILVVKDDAYGFGIDRIVQLSWKVGIDFFAVKNIEEAVCVRNIMPHAKILLLGKVQQNQLKAIKQYQIIPTMNDFDDYLLFKENEIAGHLAIDVGMNRFGMKTGYLDLINDPIITAIYTHLYDESNCLDKIKWIEELAKNYHKELHIGGSMAYNRTKASLRIGRMAYEKALYFYGHIVNIKHLKKGETVGYDGHFKAERDTLIGVCDIGYSNGLTLFFHGDVFIKNHFYKCVGKCCMDQSFILIDEKVSLGDEVEFFGNHIDEHSFAEENNMSLYEVFLTINQEKEIVL